MSASPSCREQREHEKVKMGSKWEQRKKERRGGEILQKTCLPSHCLLSILILKASRKLSEEALSVHASTLRRKDQKCVFHHECAISP